MPTFIRHTLYVLFVGLAFVASPMHNQAQAALDFEGERARQKSIATAARLHELENRGAKKLIPLANTAIQQGAYMQKFQIAGAPDLNWLKGIVARADRGDLHGEPYRRAKQYVREQADGRLINAIIAHDQQAINGILAPVAEFWQDPNGSNDEFKAMAMAAGKYAASTLVYKHYCLHGEPTKGPECEETANRDKGLYIILGKSEVPRLAAQRTALNTHIDTITPSLKKCDDPKPITEGITDKTGQPVLDKKGQAKTVIVGYKMGARASICSPEKLLKEFADKVPSWRKQLPVKGDAELAVILDAALSHAWTLAKAKSAALDQTTLLSLAKGGHTPEPDGDNGDSLNVDNKSAAQAWETLELQVQAFWKLPPNIQRSLSDDALVLHNPCFTIFTTEGAERSKCSLQLSSLLASQVGFDVSNPVWVACPKPADIAAFKVCLDEADNALQERTNQILTIQGRAGSNHKDLRYVLIDMPKLSWQSALLNRTSEWLSKPIKIGLGILLLFMAALYNDRRIRRKRLVKQPSTQHQTPSKLHKL